MPLLASGLVVISCALHALWNLLLKRAESKFAFTALFLIATPFTFAPMLSLFPPHIPTLLGWICIFATGVVYAAYFIGLAKAYSVSDLSFAYPLSRGLGPALTVVWGTILLGERPTVIGLAGIALVLIGAFSLQWQPQTSLKIRSMLDQSTMPAWFVGVAYSVYSIIDKIAVGHLRVHPAVYIYATYSVCAAIVFLFALRHCSREELRREWQRNWKLCIATSVLNIVAYLLVLWAMSLPNTPVSYIIPLRTLSVLFGVLFGTEILGEGGRLKKLVSAVFLMAGAALISFG